MPIGEHILRFSAAKVLARPPLVLRQQVNRLANKDGSGGYQVYGRRYMLELTARF